MPSRLSAFLPRIIGALFLLVLGGCSAVKIGYNNAPALAYWWLDGYVDFHDAQAVQVRDSLAGLHAWHRKTELPLYADVLRQVQRMAAGPVTPQQVCEISDQVRARVNSLGEQASEGMSRVVPTLKPPQLRHLAQQFDKHNQSWREEWLDGTPAERTARRLDKALERAEGFYGRLDEPQRAVLRQSIQNSAFDATLAWRERQRRQQDLLQVLREHSQGVRAAHVKAEILALHQRNMDSPDPAYRGMFERVVSDSCRDLAALHNSTNANQRRELLKTLKNYENDLKALMAAS